MILDVIAVVLVAGVVPLLAGRALGATWQGFALTYGIAVSVLAFGWLLGQLDRWWGRRP